MKRTNRTLFIHNTARGRIKFLLLALFAFQGLQAQKLFPAPSAIETYKGTFSYDEVSAKCVRTTISKSLPAIGIEYSDEAYQLEITPDSIFIDATSAKGAFYEAGCFCIRRYRHCTVHHRRSGRFLAVHRKEGKIYHYRRQRAVISYAAMNFRG